MRSYFCPGTSSVIDGSMQPPEEHTYCYKDKDDSFPVSTSTQTDLTAEDLDNMEKELDIKNKKLQNKSNLSKEIFIETVTKSNESVKQYTGLPGISVLNGLFSILDSNSDKLSYWRGKQTKQCSKKSGPSRKLTKYEEYILTLVRFRLGLLNFFVGDIFGISDTRVSQIFITWINFMYATFSPCVKWPTMTQIQMYMPNSFKQLYPSTRVIIDCTELFIQRPKQCTAQSCTYSTYKSHNTYKALIGISPTGLITYISDLWGGNVSDRYITEHSGFLDLLEAGDEVMADRGFTIRDLLAFRRCKLTIPPFTKKCKWGKGKKLNTADIKKTRQIARLRIHVERAIGRLKEWRLINQTMPLKLKPIANQLLVIAGFFCNLLPPLVKK
jgi:hypothetical protein